MDGGQKVFGQRVLAARKKEYTASLAVWGQGRAGPGQGGAAWHPDLGPPLGGAVEQSLFPFPTQHYS